MNKCISFVHLSFYVLATVLHKLNIDAKTHNNTTRKIDKSLLLGTGIT